MPAGRIYAFYINVRVGGRGYEEFVNRAMGEDDRVYIRGRVFKAYSTDDDVMVWKIDTFTGRKIESTGDLVVVASAIVPSGGVRGWPRCSASL